MFFMNKILSEKSSSVLISAVQKFLGKFLYAHVISLAIAILKQLKIFRGLHYKTFYGRNLWIFIIS